MPETRLRAVDALKEWAGLRFRSSSKGGLQLPIIC